MGADETKKKGNKEAKRDFDLRVRRIVRLLSLGGTRGDAIQYAQDQYEVSERTAIRLYTAAMAEIREAWNIERPDMAAHLLTQASTVAQRAMKQENWGAVLQSLAFQARITKLDR